MRLPILLLLIPLSMVTAAGCGGGQRLPAWVSGTVEVTGDGREAELALSLIGDVGGGCNVGGTYDITTETEVIEDRVVVTVTGHTYDSDGGECADVAGASTVVPLPPLAVDESYPLEIVVGEERDVFTLAWSGGELTIGRDSGSDLGLRCRALDDRPSTACGR